MQLTAIRHTTHVALLCLAALVSTASANNVAELTLFPFSQEMLNQQRPFEHYDFDLRYPDRLQLKSAHTSALQRKAIAQFKLLSELTEDQAVRLRVDMPRDQMPDDCSKGCLIEVQTLSCLEYDLLPGETVAADGSFIVESAIAPGCIPMVMINMETAPAEVSTDFCRECQRIEGTFHIRYLRGHFGQLFYEALPAPKQ